MTVTACAHAVRVKTNNKAHDQVLFLQVLQSSFNLPVAERGNVRCLATANLPKITQIPDKNHNKSSVQSNPQEQRVLHLPRVLSSLYSSARDSHSLVESHLKV